MLDARFPTLFFANGIGDHFINLPAVRALAHLFPSRLALICQAGTGPEVFHGIRFRTICNIETTTVGRQRRFDADHVAAHIGPCDFLISLNPWHSPSVDRLLRLLSPRFSLGFFPAFKRHVPLNFDKHSAELAFDIPRVFKRSISLDAFARPPSFAPEFTAQARRIRRTFPTNARLLAVHADTGMPKMWPRRRFIRLLDSFLQHRPEFLAVVLGSVDLQLDSGRLGEQVIPALGLPLATSALVLSRADLFVGVDSSMLHAADLFRVPGVGIFGPTEPLEWGFRFAPHRHERASRRLSTLHERKVLHALEELARQFT